MAATGGAYKAARRLRKAMSLPEALLWRLLRRSQPPIRRQHPIGRFVVDFYCPAAGVAFEIDGYAHSTGIRPLLDEERQRWLEAQGVKVVRIEAKDVLRDPEESAEAMLRLCQGLRTPPPQR